jgi:hypothetical protein
MCSSVTFLAAKAFAAAKKLSVSACAHVVVKNYIFRGVWRPESRQVINSTGELGRSRTASN